MKRHDEITFLRNRYRARELREFRALVEDYFARMARDPDGAVVDWDGAQAARAQIHRRLPRVIQVVRAAGLEPGSPHFTTDPGPGLGQVDVLQRIFSSRYAEGGEQEIYDILDMALGVYDGEQIVAFGRTFNPFYYAAMVLGLVGRAPRRLVRALGLGGGPSRRALAEEVARLEGVAARFADLDEAIDRRLESLHERQAARLAEQARHILELEERLDFAERVLARGQAPEQLPGRGKPHHTPV